MCTWDAGRGIPPTGAATWPCTAARVVSFDFAIGIVPGIWHIMIFPPCFVAGAIYSDCDGAGAGDPDCSFITWKYFITA